MCQPWGEKKRRRYLKQSQFECWMQSSKKRKKSSLCLSRNKERISSRISSCPKRLYNTSQVTHKCRTKIQLHFRFQYDAIHSLKFYHQWPRPGASTRSPSVYLCWPTGTREFLWVLCGRPAGRLTALPFRSPAAAGCSPPPQPPPPTPICRPFVPKVASMQANMCWARSSQALIEVQWRKYVSVQVPTILAGYHRQTLAHIHKCA